MLGTDCQTLRTQKYVRKVALLETNSWHFSETMIRGTFFVHLFYKKGITEPAGKRVRRNITKIHEQLAQGLTTVSTGSPKRVATPSVVLSEHRKQS